MGKRLSAKISTEAYEVELLRLQTELVKLQEWTRVSGVRIAVIFEGRDAAGKGGTIKRITEYLSPRVARVAALPTPTEREPAAPEAVLTIGSPAPTLAMATGPRSRRT